MLCDSTKQLGRNCVSKLCWLWGVAWRPVSRTDAAQLVEEYHWWVECCFLIDDSSETCSEPGTTLKGFIYINYMNKQNELGSYFLNLYFKGTRALHLLLLRMFLDKLNLIVAVHKVNDKKDNKYRPISILLNISKIG